MRKKSLRGYVIAVIVGIVVFAPILIIPLGELDDSGGVETVVGIVIALTIYQFLL
jgi:hypothetical protein